VRGHAAFAEGVGEILTPVTPEEPWYVVLVPQVSVSTAEIFSDPLLTRDTPPIKVRPVPKGNSRNDCLTVVARRYPDVRNALNLLGKFTEAKLTGTGSCVFGAFPNKAEADKVSALLTETLTGFVAKGSNVFDVASQVTDTALREPNARHSLQQIQGRRQAVRQQVLILPCVGSNPAAPAIFL
jgi:4-diphosphocytidyl-2-C-methyl-D-erythritol kinase